MKIHFFDKELEKFIMFLEKSAIAKTLHTIDLLEKFGHNLRLPHSKKVRHNLFELRIYGVQGIRILYTFYKNSVILLHGFKKKSQRIPQKEIKLAVQKIEKLDKI